MHQQKTRDLEGWVAFLSHTEIPVLKQTARDLALLYEDSEHLGARGVAGIIARDPMLTVKLLRYLQQHKHRKQEHEVMQVEQALPYASSERPLFSIGSSGIETALAPHLTKHGRRRESGVALTEPHRQGGVASAAAGQLLVASGSCSPVTGDQIAWARANGFAEVALDTVAIVTRPDLGS